MSNLLKSYYELLQDQELAKSELIDIINKNPKFIKEELSKADSDSEIKRIFAPYLDVIEKAIKNNKKHFSDAIIYNIDGRILMLLRGTNTEIEPKKWGLPGGHIDEGETPEEAVIREVNEETNFNVENVFLRHIKEDDKCKIHYYMCYVDPDQLAILDHEEHHNLKWVNRDELQELDTAFDIKDILNQIVFPIELIEKGGFGSGVYFRRKKKVSYKHDDEKEEGEEVPENHKDINDEKQFEDHDFYSGHEMEDDEPDSKFSRYKDANNRFNRKGFALSKALENIQVAFDNGLITEEKYFEYLEKAKPIGYISPNGKWRKVAYNKWEPIKEGEHNNHELSNLIWLYHETDHTNVDSILKDGLKPAVSYEGASTSLSQGDTVGVYGDSQFKVGLTVNEAIKGVYNALAATSCSNKVKDKIKKVFKNDFNIDFYTEKDYNLLEKIGNRKQLSNDDKKHLKSFLETDKQMGLEIIIDHVIKPEHLFLIKKHDHNKMNEPVIKGDERQIKITSEDDFIKELKREYPNGVDLYHETSIEEGKQIKEEGYFEDQDIFAALDEPSNFIISGDKAVLKFRIMPEYYKYITADQEYLGNDDAETWKNVTDRHQTSLKGMYVCYAGYAPKSEFEIQNIYEPVKGLIDYRSNPDLNFEHKQIETKFGNYLNTHLQEAEQKYLTDNGNVLGGDNAKDLSEDYMANKTELSEAVHEPSSSFIKYLYAKELATPVLETSNNTVVFTAGGSGAGKTTGISQFKGLSDIEKKANIIYDTTMTSFKSAETKIDQALKAGRDVHIMYVYRDPVEAFVNGVIPRLIKTGRAIPYYAHAHNHIDAHKTILALVNKYKIQGSNDHVSFSFIDNSHGKNKAKEITFEDVKRIDYFSPIEYENDLLKIINEQYKNGQITEQQYKGLKGSRDKIGKSWSSRIEELGDRRERETIYEEVSRDIEFSRIEKALSDLQSAFDEGNLDTETYFNYLEKAKQAKKILHHRKDTGKTYYQTHHVGNDNEKEIDRLKNQPGNEDSASNLLNYLEQMSKMNFGGKQGEFFNWQLHNAKQIKLTLTEEIRKRYPDIDDFLNLNQVVQKQCYKNASRLTTHVEGVHYVEGLISCYGIPIEHAWNEIDGLYFDTTKDIALKDHEINDYIEIMNLNDQDVFKYMDVTGTYGSFIGNKFLDDTSIEKAEKTSKLGDEKTWHGKKFKLQGHGWTYADEKESALKQDKKTKLKIQDFSDEELEEHAHRSSEDDLKKVIKESRHPKLRNIAQKHLATRKEKETEHSLYELMVLEEKEDNHDYNKDKNTIHFDKYPGDDVINQMNKLGISYLVNSKELIKDSKSKQKK